MRQIGHHGDLSRWRVIQTMTDSCSASWSVICSDGAMYFSLFDMSSFFFVFRPGQAIVSKKVVGMHRTIWDPFAIACFLLFILMMVVAIWAIAITARLSALEIWNAQHNDARFYQDQTCTREINRQTSKSRIQEDIESASHVLLQIPVRNESIAVCGPLFIETVTYPALSQQNEQIPKSNARRWRSLQLQALHSRRPEPKRMTCSPILPPFAFEYGDNRVDLSPYEVEDETFGGRSLSAAPILGSGTVNRDSASSFESS